MMFLADAWYALSSLLFPARTMEVTSPMPLILSSHRNWDTEAFLGFLWDQAMQKPDPSVILKIFRVTSMEFRKTNWDAEHEFLTLKVSGETADEVHRFILERTVSINDHDDLDSTTIDQFFNHEDSQKLLDTVSKVIQPISSSSSSGPSPSLASLESVAVAGAALAAGPALLIPLVLNSTSSSSSSSSNLLPLINEGVHTPLPSLEYSYFDRTSMAMAEILQAVSRTKVGSYVSKSLNKPKPPKDSRAEDQFVGGDMLNSIDYNLLFGTRVGDIQPKTLTLFHLALLAHVVHQEYPLYSLFSNQCYWYSSTIFYAAQIIDQHLSNINQNLKIHLDDKSDRQFDDFFLPFHLFQPKEAGRWKGIQISGCKEVVLSTVVEKFYLQLDKFMLKVSYIFFTLTIY